MKEERDRWNGARFVANDEGGHYESWFQRANHPERPLAFWIRYTIFSPKGRSRDAIGELWAMYFDGETKRVVATKEEVPIARCSFAKSLLDARIAESQLDGEGLRGEASGHGHAIKWSLRYQSSAAPLLLLQRRLYGGSFPKAKVLVAAPNARYDGELEVDGERVVIDGWIGSQNHNWGSQHTDRYAWGQVSGFDDAPDAFLELSTARVKIGPVLIPAMTPMVLRLDGREWALNALPQAMRARGRYDYFHWSFESRTREIEVSGTIAAPSWAFVGLPYYNPPGGTKTCLNSKIARCDLSVRVRGDRVRVLSSAHRAAFEILTDAHDHGVRML